MTERCNIVRIDPALGISGLFRPLQASRLRPAFSARQFFGGLEFEWVAPQALGVPEQTLLLVLLGLARPKERLLDVHPETATGRQLREALASAGDHFSGITSSIHTSLRELAQLSGYGEAGGSTLNQVRQMLRRLAEVTVWIRTPDREASSRLLSVVFERTGTTRVALNTRLAAAAWGESHYAQICLAQRLALGTQTAMALHAHLSATIRPGNHHRYRFVTLEKAVWGNNVDGTSFRSRKAKLVAALGKVGTVGWVVTIAGDVVDVARQSSNGTPAKRQRA